MLTRQLSGADLRLVNLSGSNIERSDLAGADLSYAHLESANLLSVSLKLADLSWASCSDANLGEADLTSANLSSADFSGAVLANADLSHASLQFTKLAGANLYRALLAGAVGITADLSHATLTEANLMGADLRNAKLTGADLTHAKLTGVQLMYSDLSGSNLSGADLSGAILELDRSELEGYVTELQDAAIAASRPDLAGVIYDDETHWPTGFDPTLRHPSGRFAHRTSCRAGVIGDTQRWFDGKRQQGVGRSAGSQLGIDRCSTRPSEVFGAGCREGSDNQGQACGQLCELGERAFERLDDLSGEHARRCRRTRRRYTSRIRGPGRRSKGRSGLPLRPCRFPCWGRWLRPGSRPAEPLADRGDGVGRLGGRVNCDVAAFPGVLSVAVTAVVAGDGPA